MAGPRLTDEEIERMYRERGHVVLRRAGQILGREDEAREVVQEVFAGLVGKPAQFAGGSSVTTWLYSVTTHLCLNRLRDARTRARLLAEAVAPAGARAAAPVGEDRAAVRAFLARLPEPLAQLAVYFYVDEMSHEEIARVTGQSRRQVGRLLERVEDSMRKERGS
jgi:RNA polymerase sigma-70 factor (ECF subfamily)